MPPGATFPKWSARRRLAKACEGLRRFAGASKAGGEPGRGARDNKYGDFDQCKGKLCLSFTGSA